MATFQAFLRLPMRKEICFEGDILSSLHTSVPRNGRSPQTPGFCNLVGLVQTQWLGWPERSLAERAGFPFLQARQCVDNGSITAQHSSNEKTPAPVPSVKPPYRQYLNIVTLHIILILTFTPNTTQIIAIL